jgi:hypothetical protein
MESVIKLALDYGLLPALFVWLFFYQLKSSEKREENYKKVIDEGHVREEKLQVIIHELAEKFKDIEEGIKRIERRLENGK